VFISVGVLTVNYSSFDIILVIIVGILGYGMRLCDFPPAPLLLGYVLGPLMEEHFRRAMLVSHGSFDAFLTRPISATCLGITAALLIFGFWSAYAGRRSGANAVLP
jgi:TctA family transporter